MNSPQIDEAALRSALRNAVKPVYMPDQSDWVSNLKGRIEHSIQYYADEFPADEYYDVWKKPIGFCNGVTPMDLHDILQLLPNKELEEKCTCTSVIITKGKNND